MLDVMNKEPKQLSEEQKAIIDKIKTMGNEFFNFLSSPNGGPDGYATREAKVKLEECVMWAVKDVCLR
jgi:hypothetical protein